MTQFQQRNLVRIKVLLVGPETNSGTRVALPDLANRFELAVDVAAFEGHQKFVTRATDRDFQPLGQRIDNGHPDPVQTAGELVVVVRELATGMQGGEDDFHPRLLHLGVHVDRHAPPIIDNFQRTILEQLDLDISRMSSQCLVDTVVDDLLGKMIGPLCIGVHSGAFSHRIESAEDFDGSSIILATHKKYVLFLLPGWGCMWRSVAQLP